MKIQSLSVVVPTKKCVNDCPFCVSKMAALKFTNQVEQNVPFYDLYQRDYVKRLQFARDNGCNTVILTGDGEALQNKNFLISFAHMNGMLTQAFRCIELQTTGVLLDEAMLRFLRNTVGVNTISLSISDLFDFDNNAKIVGMPQTPQLKFDMRNTIGLIKKYDFNLRYSLNMLDTFDSHDILEIFMRLVDLNADQVIFREMYKSGINAEIDSYIEKHASVMHTADRIESFVKSHGQPLERLPFGAIRYSLYGISTVIDADCMASKAVSEELKYLVLQPNCKLYSKWNDKASLIF